MCVGDSSLQRRFLFDIFLRYHDIRDQIVKSEIVPEILTFMGH